LPITGYVGPVIRWYAAITTVKITAKIQRRTDFKVLFIVINLSASSPAPLLLQEKGTGVEVLWLILRGLPWGSYHLILKGVVAMKKETAKSQREQ
jgi:hypothetical protein